MNEVTSQNLQSPALRVSVVSSKPVANKTNADGNNLPHKQALSIKHVDSVESPKVKKESIEVLRKNIVAAVAQMNEYTQSTQRDIQFNVDKVSGRTVVKVVDRASNEVIRQIPDKVFLKLAQQLKESLASGNEEPLHLISAKA